MIMAKDTMFCMAVITERESSFREERGELKMHILEVFFGLLGMTLGAVHVHKSLPEVHIGIGMGVAIHTRQLSRFMHILGPSLRIHVQRPDCAVAEDLGEVGIAMADQAFLVCVLVQVRRGVEEDDGSKETKEK